MKKLPKGVAPGKRVRMGLAVNVLLTRGKQTDLAARALAASEDVKHKARAHEDAQHMASATRALKKACDGELDDLARDVRFALLSRSRDAEQSAPYTQIFHSGLGYYTEAREADELATYTELSLNMGTYLPAGDALLTTSLPVLQGHLDDWSKVLARVTEAETAETQAKIALEESTTAFDAAMDSIYGALFAELGRKGADRFFP